MLATPYSEPNTRSINPWALNWKEKSQIRIIVGADFSLHGRAELDYLSEPRRKQKRSARNLAKREAKSRKLYRRLIAKADERLDEHQARIEEGGIPMPVTLKNKMDQLSPAQRKKVDARAAELITREMTLRDLRHARKLTQVKMARTLGVTQESVSRLEKRSDLLLSPLPRRFGSVGGIHCST